jgi:hypothetical protein
MASSSAGPGAGGIDQRLFKGLNTPTHRKLVDPTTFRSGIAVLTDTPARAVGLT